jgi:hypothetical protein
VLGLSLGTAELLKKEDGDGTTEERMANILFCGLKAARQYE